jgi:predicted metal-dependent peptidase
MAARKRSKNPPNPAAEAFFAGCRMVYEHPLFARLYGQARIVCRTGTGVPDDGWAIVSPDGYVYVHPTRRQTPEEWAFVLASALLHLGFGHFSKDRPYGPVLWNAACSATVARFLRDLKFGRPPFPERGIMLLADLPLRDERAWFAWFEREGLPEAFADLSIAGPTAQPLLPAVAKRYGPKTIPDWPGLLADGVRESARLAVEVASGSRDRLTGERRRSSRMQRAREWVMSSYPLLGGLASHFDLIEDAELCRRMDINIAAVSETMEEIYVNPAAALSEPELVFVYAHELLHVGLRHHDRCEGRDAYLWNVACDFVINHWLLEMNVGTAPERGLLLDEQLEGLSAEEIYDRMTGDMRIYRKLATLAGRSAGDMLDRHGAGRRRDGFTDLDDFYRSALARGYELHCEQGRGLLPAGLVEEIRSLAQPPIAWDVALAQWFDERFPPLQKYRTYARLSRRQSATPDIPRAHWTTVELERRTFGVVLDTSGSMDRELLAKALGAIASYSAARDVTAVRLVFCDARAYDEGYVAVEEIAQRVRVKGRGGTVLQPGIDLLEEARNFPPTGPILVITDGYCDVFTVRRDHAILMPAGSRPPFTPRGPIFRIR